MKTTLFALPLAVLTLTGCAGGVDTGPGTGDDAIDGKADSAASTSAGRFETFTGKDGQLYFHLLAANGEKVLQSEGYVSKQGMTKGLDSVRFNGAIDSSYQLLQSADGEWYFNLLAGNYEVVGTSELYASKSNAERGLETVVGPGQGGRTGVGAAGRALPGVSGPRRPVLLPPARGERRDRPAARRATRAARRRSPAPRRCAPTGRSRPATSSATRPTARPTSCSRRATVRSSA